MDRDTASELLADVENDDARIVLFGWLFRRGTAQARCRATRRHESCFNDECALAAFDSVFTRAPFARDLIHLGGTVIA